MEVSNDGLSSISEFLVANKNSISSPQFCCVNQGKSPIEKRETTAGTAKSVS
jgi:hypothetical protein